MRWWEPKIAVEKSYNFSTNPEAKRWLKEVTWPTTAGKIQVVDDFKYLGAQVSMGTKISAKVITRRFLKAARMARKIGALNLSRTQREVTIMTKILPFALYGIEQANPTESSIKELTAAILDALVGKGAKRSVDLTFCTVRLGGRELDPAVLIVTNRVLALRRAQARREETKEEAQKLIRMYEAAKKKKGTTKNQEEGHEDTEPAPHPNQASRVNWLQRISPHGPIGLLIQSLSMIGARIGEDGVIKMNDEADVDIFSYPYQALQYILCERARQRRTTAAAAKSDRREFLQEIDTSILIKAQAKLDPDQAKYIAYLHRGGEWDKALIKQKIDHSTDDVCRYCGRESQTLDHLVWECGHFQELRKRCAPGFGENWTGQLPWCIRRGIPPALRIDENRSFWGQAFPQQLTDVESAFLGIQHELPRDTAGYSIWRQAAVSGKSVRQCMEEYRSGEAQGEGGWPDVPGIIEGAPPCQPMMYTDGALKMPRHRDLSIGGCGIWFPDDQQDERGVSMDIALRFLHHEPWKGGHAFWAPLRGLWQTAARAELAALVLASHCAKPIHIGIDNKGVVDKANMLLQIAQEKRQADGSLPKKPLKKPFTLQADGDLWQQWWKIVEARTPESIAITKVKGHATDQMVQEGKVRAQDKAGNDEAVSAADKAVHSHKPGIMSFITKIQERQEAYAELIRQAMVLNCTVAKRIREDEHGHKDTPEPASHNWTLEPVTFKGPLCYPEDNGQLVELKIMQPPRGNHQYKSQMSQLCGIAEFLSALRWELATEERPGGISWIELYAIFQLSGWDWHYTRDYFRIQREKDRQDPRSAEARMIKHRGRRQAEDDATPSAKVRTQNTCRADLDEFKRRTRFLLRHSEDMLTKIVFTQAQDHGNTRLLHLGFLGHLPCIRATPHISKELAIRVTAALLMLRPNTSLKTVNNAQESMRAPCTEGAVQIQLKRIKIWMLQPARWRKMLSWIPAYCGNEAKREEQRSRQKHEDRVGRDAIEDGKSVKIRKKSSCTDRDEERVDPRGNVRNTGEAEMQDDPCESSVGITTVMQANPCANTGATNPHASQTRANPRRTTDNGKAQNQDNPWSDGGGKGGKEQGERANPRDSNKEQPAQIRANPRGGKKCRAQEKHEERDNPRNSADDSPRRHQQGKDTHAATMGGDATKKEDGRSTKRHMEQQEPETRGIKQRITKKDENAIAQEDATGKNKHRKREEETETGGECNKKARANDCMHKQHTASTYQGGAQDFPQRCTINTTTKGDEGALSQTIYREEPYTPTST